MLIVEIIEIGNLKGRVLEYLKEAGKIRMQEVK